MHTRPPTLDEAYYRAREHAFQAAPRGCSCAHATKRTRLRGTCPWCRTYWAARREIETEEMQLRLQASRERIQKAVERISQWQQPRAPQTAAPGQDDPDRAC